jgi:hypothetical protein
MKRQIFIDIRDYIKDDVDKTTYNTEIKYYNDRRYVIASAQEMCLYSCNGCEYDIDSHTIVRNYAVSRYFKQRILSRINSTQLSNFAPIANIKKYDAILNDVYQWNCIMLGLFGQKFTCPTFDMKSLINSLTGKLVVVSYVEENPDYIKAILLTYIRDHYLLLYDMAIYENKKAYSPFISNECINIIKRNKNIENILKEYKLSIKESDEKAKKLYAEYVDSLRFRRGGNSNHFGYFDDSELNWCLKNVLNEDFKNIDNDPEFKFYNMSLKDMLDGNF